MESKIKQALEQFEALCEPWVLAPGHMEKLAPYAYVWHPSEVVDSDHTKPLGLTVQAITHGNEVGGIEVLLSCLELLKSGLLQPSFAVGFALGNPAAALANKRFLERDLNRSFGQQGSSLLEEGRARALEPLLKKSRFFLDIHQTIEPSLSPFFIFPYTPTSYAFAEAIAQGIPIVTHWGNSFSKDGMCSDEFVNECGGTGITIELGQKGFHPYHQGVGLLAALAALSYASRLSKGSRLAAPAQAEIYTWKTVVPYADGMSLDEGLYNFQALKRGQKIGKTRQGPLEVEADGFLLFPKYRRDPQAPQAKELYRIAQRISREQLGMPDVFRQ